MARAAIYALIRLDVPNIFIINRTLATAEKVAAHFTEVATSFRNSSRSPISRNIRHRILVIGSMDDPWPAEYEQPTIIISCIPAHQIEDEPAPNLSIPLPWLQSVNGGVIVEVNELCFLFLLRIESLSLRFLDCVQTFGLAFTTTSSASSGKWTTVGTRQWPSSSSRTRNCSISTDDGKDCTSSVDSGAGLCRAY